MPCPHATLEEHELPCIEAVLAGTLALMTGYSQALQAALGPQHRLKMGAKIGANLALLAEHPQLSAGFRQVLLGLQRRWHAMAECTEQAVHGGGGPLAGATPVRRHDMAAAFQFSAPKRLQ